MYTAAALLDVHERAHRSLAGLLAHGATLDGSALNRTLEGFGYPTVRLQLHHLIGAEEYWIGVLQGRLDADDNDAAYPTAQSLEDWRQKVARATATYLRGASGDELNTVRIMTTWGPKEQRLMPARVVMRTMMHLFHHQGQVAAMCRLLGKPVPAGLDFPIL